MTVAAVYARKSADQRGVADDAKSVRRQIDHGSQYASQKGWTVDEACIFVDDGISGAEFANRPGFVRLMNSLKPRPPFQVLVMSEESRLGREQIEVSYALKQIITAGVRVFCYLTDTERTLDSPIEKVMLALQGMSDEMEREKARQRARDKAEQLARAGYVVGGRCFGYDNVPIVDAAGVRSHVEQRINETEAAIVRRMFELAAAGHGQPTIAKMLNAEGAPAPRSQQDRPRAWVQSSVHAVLHRRRYVGEIVWNQTRKRDRWGQRHQTDRDRAEWISVPAPHLRIVSDELWTTAHAQIEAQRRSTNIRARAKDSKYLLPGLARCAWCSGGLHVRTRTRSHGRHLYFYACTSHFNRGESVCRNLMQFPMADIDRAVIRRIANLLRPELVDEVVGRVRELVAPDHQASLRDRLAQQLKETEQQAAHLADAIALGGDVPALVARLQAVEQTRQELGWRLQALGDGPLVPRVDWRLVDRQARRLLADWRGLLTRHPSEARPLLRELLEAPIRFTPILEAHRRGYRFEGAVAVGGMLAGTVVAGNLCGNKFGVPGQN